MLNGAAVVRRTKLAEHVARVAAEREKAEREAERLAKQERKRLKLAAEKAANEAKARLERAAMASNGYYISAKKTTIANVVFCCAVHFKVTSAEIRGPSRMGHLIRPRQVAMFIAYEEKIGSLPQIGRFLGGRDHTTVLHGVEKVRGLLSDGRQPWVDDVAAVRAMAFHESAE